jgi:hypothetical protein
MTANLAASEPRLRRKIEQPEGEGDKHKNTAYNANDLPMRPKTNENEAVGTKRPVDTTRHGKRGDCDLAQSEFEGRFLLRLSTHNSL